MWSGRRVDNGVEATVNRGVPDWMWTDAVPKDRCSIYTRRSEPSETTPKKAGATTGEEVTRLLQDAIIVRAEI